MTSLLKTYGFAIFGGMAAVALGFSLLSSRPVSVVGSWEIHRTDVDLRDRVVQAYFPGAGRGAGLAQLEQSARYLQVLEKNGVTLTKREIEEEARRIDRSTKDPKRLAEIKAIFGEDREAYLKNYVLPALVDRVIQFEFFPLHAEAHGISLKRARELLSKVHADPAHFQDILSAEGLPVASVILSLKSGLEWQGQHTPSGADAVRDESPRDRPEVWKRVQKEQAVQRVQQAKNWHDEFAGGLKDGEVLDRPVNDALGFLLIRRIGTAKNGDIRLQIATVPKIDFETWYRSELEEL